MKVDQATFAAHGAALVEAAGRLFRGRGLGGVTIADVSRAAGLTHGAFYGHYPSKDALVAASCRRGLLDSAAKWRARAAAAPDPVAAIIDRYLTQTHRDEPETGCALPALGPEAARDGGDIAAAMADGAGGLLAVLEETLAASHPALTAEARAQAACGILAVLVGGIVLARALKPDLAGSAAALESARLAAHRLIPT